jgi:NADH-quinone oxidoreductase subunit N
MSALIGGQIDGGGQLPAELEQLLQSVESGTTAVSGLSGVAEVAAPVVAWAALVPIIVLALGALLLLTLASLLRTRLGPGFFTGWTIGVGLVSFVTAIPVWAQIQGWEQSFLWWDPSTTAAGPFSTLGGAMGVDGFSVLLTMLIALSVVVCALVMSGYARREGDRHVEGNVLLLLSAVGAVVMVGANDLIVLFLGLETLSMAVYVLAAMNLRRVESQEAGLKYFVLGAFSSAFFLYGIAMVYGGTGSTSLVSITDFLSTNLLLGGSSVLVLLGIALMVAGFAFKIAAVPFHAWSPDVYDGAPTASVAFMASVVKVAAFAGMVRVLVVGFDTFAADWRPILQVLAVLSLVGGALLAVVQTNIKRLLAYSSISHAGFILLGVEAASDQGNRAVLVYLVAYTFMVIGSFAVVSIVGRTGDAMHSVDAYRGLGRVSPALAVTFTFLLLSQAGVPFTSGFYAKFYAVVAAVDAQSAWLAVVAMLSAVVAAYLYLRLVVTMWFVAPGDQSPSRGLFIPASTGVALVVCVAVTLFIGVAPDPLTEVVDKAQPVIVQPPAIPVAVDPDALDIDELLSLIGGNDPGGAGAAQTPSAGGR